jgi:hypothetical protein
VASPECSDAVFAVNEPPLSPAIAIEADRLTTMRPTGGGPQFAIIWPTSLSVTHIHRYAQIHTAVFAVNEPPFAPIIDVVLEPDRLTTMRPIGGGPQFTIVQPASFSVAHIDRHAQIGTPGCR